jgi:beta-lactamase class C
MFAFSLRYGAPLLLACSTAATAANPVAAQAQAVMQQYGIPGMAIAITVNGQQQFYNYGVSDKASGIRVSRDTLFEVGSISKTLTATLATYAQAKGQLSLTASPTRYLPALRGSQLDNVQMLHLATHTPGGFPLQFPDEVKTDRQMLEYFNAWQPTYGAGSQRTYANPSIGLFGLATASAMKVPFAQAMEQQLLPALGMTNTYVNVPKSKIGSYAQGYTKDDKPVRVSPGMLDAEAYGIKTSTRDLLHFVEANMGLGQFDDTLRQALNDTRQGYFQLGAMTQDLVWEQYAYPVKLDDLVQGNGPQVAFQPNPVTTLQPPLPPQQSVWVNKTGGTTGFGAYAAFVPAKKIGVVILANKNYPNEERVKLAYRIIEGL